MRMCNRVLKFASQILISLLLLVQVVSLPATAESTNSQIAVARRLLDGGKWTAAEAAYRQLATGRGAIRQIGLHGLGEIFLRMRRIDELFVMTEQAVKEFPDSSDALAAHAAAWAMKAQRSSHLMYKMSQAGKAVEWADRAISIQADQPLAHFVRGLVHFHMPNILNRTASAARDLEAVLASRDKQREHFLVDSYWYLALSYRKIRQTKKAIRILQEAQQRWPQLAAFAKKQHEFEVEEK